MSLRRYDAHVSFLEAFESENKSEIEYLPKDCSNLNRFYESLDCEERE